MSLQKVVLNSGQRIWTHFPEECAGRPCSIHQPSQHHMASWPQRWRSDRDLMERFCSHGVGHPDPDHLAHVFAFAGEEYARLQTVHGCDGCCHPELQQLERQEPHEHNRRKTDRHHTSPASPSSDQKERGIR